MVEAVRKSTRWHTWQRTLRRRADQEAGSALVEFAFSLLVLLMLTFGLIDLGRAVYAANVVQTAAQTGARAGVVNLAAAVPAVRDRLLGLDPAKAQIVASVVSDERVDVEVTYEFQLITPFVSQLVDDGVVNLSGSASMLTH